jgi:hypothetical protein
VPIAPYRDCICVTLAVEFFSEPLQLTSAELNHENSWSCLNTCHWRDCFDRVDRHHGRSGRQRYSVTGGGSRFECPKTIEGTTPDKRAEIRTLLPSENVMDNPVQLNASIDGLKRLGLSRTLIIDHLIGAYCPTVAQNSSLSNAEKAVEVR